MKINTFYVILLGFVFVALVGGLFLLFPTMVSENSINSDALPLETVNSILESGSNIQLEESATVKMPEIADISAPSAPDRLSGTPLSTQVNISWSASSDDTGVVGYKIYQSEKLIGSTNGTKFAVINLSPSTTYSFKVVAFDNFSKSSAPSSTIYIKTLAKLTLTPMLTPTSTLIPIPIPTSTPTPTLTPALALTPTPIPMSISTPTLTPMPTSTPAPTATPGVAQTYTVNVSQNSISPSAQSIHLGDTIQFVFQGGDEAILSFSPSIGKTIKLDHDNTQESYSEWAIGTYLYHVRDESGSGTITVNP